MWCMSVSVRTRATTEATALTAGLVFLLQARAVRDVCHSVQRASLDLSLFLIHFLTPSTFPSGAKYVGHILSVCFRGTGAFAWDSGLKGAFGCIFGLWNLPHGDVPGHCSEYSTLH